jgi:hypothetical protein
MHLRVIKTDARVTEWARADLLDPQLITLRMTPHGWQREPNQLKGLGAVNADGDTIAATITSDNAAGNFGVEPSLSIYSSRYSYTPSVKYAP